MTIWKRWVRSDNIFMITRMNFWFTLAWKNFGKILQGSWLVLQNKFWSTLWFISLFFHSENKYENKNKVLMSHFSKQSFKQFTFLSSWKWLLEMNRVFLKILKFWADNIRLKSIEGWRIFHYSIMFCFVSFYFTHLKIKFVTKVISLLLCL